MLVQTQLDTHLGNRLNLFGQGNIIVYQNIARGINDKGLTDIEKVAMLSCTVAEHDINTYSSSIKPVAVGRNHLAIHVTQIVAHPLADTVGVDAVIARRRTHEVESKRLGDKLMSLV